MQNNEFASEQWGRLYSRRTRFPVGPAGQKAGRGQDCPPHISRRPPYTSLTQPLPLVPAQYRTGFVEPRPKEAVLSQLQKR